MLADDVERWLADQPVQAYPEPLTIRALRWIRRHKRGVALAASAVLLATIGLAIHDWTISRERNKLALTHDALREFLQVAGENLAMIPDTEKLREFLTERLLERYREMAARYGTDPGDQLETAQVYRVLGGIERMTGQFSKSRQYYENAIKELSDLAERDPESADYARWLVETLIDRGEVNHMSSRTIDADHDFQKAIDRLDQLRSARPAAWDHSDTRASALINLSEVQLLQRRLKEAHTSADAAVSLLSSLIDATERSAARSRYCWLLAMALLDRGVASKSAGEDERAKLDLDLAKRAASQITAEDDFYNDAQFQTACIANQRGDLLTHDPSTVAASEKSYDESVQILGKLMKDHQQVPHFRQELAVAYCGRAAAREAMGRLPEALRDCQAAVEQIQGLMAEQERKGASENAQYESVLGQVLARQSRIMFLQARTPEGKQDLALSIEKLKRALEIDPARATDRVILDSLEAEAVRRGK
jgi:tetratricopeptide (TPR) repeat protein